MKLGFMLVLLVLGAANMFVGAEIVVDIPDAHSWAEMTEAHWIACAMMFQGALALLMATVLSH